MEIHIDFVNDPERYVGAQLVRDVLAAGSAEDQSAIKAFWDITTIPLQGLDYHDAMKVLWHAFYYAYSVIMVNDVRAAHFLFELDQGRPADESDEDRGRIHRTALELRENAYQIVNEMLNIEDGPRP